ncbi:hypothetical protein [Aneurinibacillus migulanus]|uniref:Serine protease n=1 Tax=Aneurinibacillus migulanus TaxID=47500 RepID=A0A1G8QVL3_ANEMI|nr:hypothetical protein [Aneurinibacillus migulanus]MCP1355830.1 hypothetical protein [Aneurinibacillus migulanus]MED0892049.1 hypothetical protein [Aneurinibacillus migulanus]MED1618658.1 hypothetical protein [Aneurinibacillus migulanus]MED4731908.1 hypothetical protein [Aneurinibacillus migulanus]SDJ08683.1 hypothetical protein SAMN04487909_111156 [Aneurinibacillus migulanus]
MMTNKASRIIGEIKQLEAKIASLKSELVQLQTSCEHVYKSDFLMKTCTRCMKAESQYY